MSEKILKYQEPIWKMLVFLLLVANLFLKVNYVSKAEYKEDKDATAKILDGLNQNLNTINLTLSAWKVQNQTLADHEARIRVLEARK